MGRNAVSIIIPSKSESRGIEQAIKSVKKYADKIIVIDEHFDRK